MWQCFIASTKGSAKSDETEKVSEAVRIAKEKAPELVLDGEFQRCKFSFLQ
ncbi:phosphate acyltransferase [Bacillus sp. SL00103]